MYSSPCSSNPNSFLAMTGFDWIWLWADPQVSKWKPGKSSSVTTFPPTSSMASTTPTLKPAEARYALRIRGIAERAVDLFLHGAAGPLCPLISAP